MKKRIERLEKKIKPSDPVPKLVFWEKEPTKEELEKLKEKNLEPVKVKFI
jgi:hypothetical protein